MDVLGVPISEVSHEEALSRIRYFLKEPKLHRIFTPNPEILVAAVQNPEFKKVLSTADLSVCDGKGIALAARGKLHRIPGVDLMADMLEIAEREHKSVFLLGSGNTQTLKNLFHYLQKTHPNLSVAGMHPGPQFHISGGEIVFASEDQKDVNYRVLKDIASSQPDIIFVAFGHEKQEFWIDRYAEYFSSARIAMGVGGAFDYISGSVRRAPKWLRNAGFEWLYRLCTQPKRLKRIMTAIIIFPYYAFIKNR